MVPTARILLSKPLGDVSADAGFQTLVQSISPVSSHQFFSGLFLLLSSLAVLTIWMATRKAAQFCRVDVRSTDFNRQLAFQYGTRSSIYLRASGNQSLSRIGTHDRFVKNNDHPLDNFKKKLFIKETSKAEKVYQNLFNLTFDPIVIIDPETHRFINVNNAGLELLGCPLDELLNRSWHDFCLPEDADRFRQCLNQNPLEFTQRFTIVTRMGKQAYVEIQAKKVDYGNQSAWFCIIRDFTESIQHELVNKAILEISRAALTVDNLSELYISVHRCLEKILPTDNIFIALYDSQTNLLSFPYFVDQFDPPPPPCPTGHGLTEYVLRTSQPLLATPDVFEDLVSRGEVETIGADSVDWLGVPLIVNGHTIGIICVQSYTEEVRLNEEAKNILVFVSSQIAMAIERKQYEERLREAKDQYRQLVEQVNAVMYTYSVESPNKYLYIGPQIETLTGYSPDRWLNETGFWFKTLHPDDLARIKKTGEWRHSDEFFYNNEYRMVTSSGRVVWVYDQAVLIRDENNEPKCWQGVIQDITQRKEMEENLRQNEATLAEVQELAHLGSFQFDSNFSDPIWSDETYRITGIPLQKPVSIEDYIALIHPDERDQVVQEIIRLVNENKSFELEYRLLLPDGTVKFIHSIGRPAVKTTNDPGRYIGMVMDITERKRTEEKLWLLSTHDVLTGLFNRAYFENQIDEMQAEKCFPVSIVMVDVDGLKLTNDTLGHSAGDELLREAGEALRASFRKQDIVARIGGDEFAILLPGMDAAAAEEALHRLNNLLNHFNLTIYQYPLHISIGVATQNPGEPLNQTLKRADGAMYKNKLYKRISG